MVNKLTKSEVICKLKEFEFQYAWINTFSDLRLIEIKNKEIEESYLEDLIEAKFFNENQEISIMKYEDEEKFSVVEFDGKDKEYVEERQILNKNKSPFEGDKDKLVIRNYIDYDEDGQAYIYYTKLCDVKGRD